MAADTKPYRKPRRQVTPSRPPPAAVEMPQTLLTFVRSTTARAAEGPVVPSPLTEDLLRQIYVLLRDRTKHDLSPYKPMPMCRSMERRMQLHRIDNPRQYLQFLIESPAELDLLFRECLIGLTRFFRDSDAFTELATHAQQLLLRAHTERRPLRLWVPGCATGEEAYSLAILLWEDMERLGLYVPVQIFATDPDRQRIQVARRGAYPKSIADDVSPTRLERFFDYVDGCYCIRRDLRNMVVFAMHNVLQDPPFIKLDLLSCRNVLIYMQPAMQRRLLSMFSNALLPQSLLFLGSSESLGNLADGFTPLHTRWKIFQRRASSTVACGAVDFLPPVPQAMTWGATPGPPAKPSDTSFRTLVERLLVQHCALPSVLVNACGDVVYIHGRTGQFLQLAQGLQHQQNLMHMACEDLRLELATAFHQATTSRKQGRQQARAETHDGPITVEIGVQALTDPEARQGLFLVTFRVMPAAPLPARPRRAPSPARIAALEHELQQLRASLRNRTAAAESINEELQATNEALHASSEDLRSANAELESTRKETQALNETLRTVNHELREKMEDLAKANNDMQNFFNSTAVSTLLLDSRLHIKRFTPQAIQLIRILPSDVGRPLRDLVLPLAYTDLEAAVQEVMQTLSPKGIILTTYNGAQYAMRIIPYRTSDDTINGTVITFVDMSTYSAGTHIPGQ